MANDEVQKPNAIMKKILIDDTPHLALFALRNIYPGQEIRYDYGPDGDTYNSMPWRKVSRKTN